MSAPAFQPGDRVRHNDGGDGTVVPHSDVQVEFDDGESISVEATDISHIADERAPFRPGDKFTFKNGSSIVHTMGSGPGFWPYGLRHSALALIARPVYPEPGQVAVVLDAEDREVLALAVEAYRARVGAAQAFTHPNVFKLNAILGRAREAIPA